MKFIAVLLAVVVVLCAVAVRGVPIRRDHRVLVNHPTREDIFNARVRRSDQYGVKGRPALTPAPIVRKGEYICGNKICKLQPGEIPKGCKGCQYPIF